jgi:hypothetical protein
MADVVGAFNEVGRAINFATVRVRSSSWWSLIVVGQFPQGFPGEHMRRRFSGVPYGLAAIRVAQDPGFRSRVAFCRRRRRFQSFAKQ